MKSLPSIDLSKELGDIVISMSTVGGGLRSRNCMVYFKNPSGRYQKVFAIEALRLNASIKSDFIPMQMKFSKEFSLSILKNRVAKHKKQARKMGVFVE